MNPQPIDMTEEETVFDPTAKKKKKKKKTPFDLESAVEGGSGAKEPVEGDESGGLPDEDLDVETFTKKKKKKKKPAVSPEEGGEEEIPEDPTSGGGNGALSDGVEDLDLENFGKKKKKKKVKDPLALDELDQAVDDVLNEDESFGLKKKKKKATADFGDDSASNDKENAPENKPTQTDDSEEATDSPWVDSDRDYTYDELLQRVFNIMRDKNPEVVAGEKKKFIMRPPQVVRVGTKKTAFVNFTEIAKMLHRQAKHLLDFLSAELGTVGAIDGNNQLIMKGRFQQKHIENVLRRYIKEYVTCHTCRSPDTILNKEARLFFLQCMVCHSRCSVQTIKTGFQAVTGKRSAIRAKQ